jgi:GNAT superfamily N-acetyltransferase
MPMPAVASRVLLANRREGRQHRRQPLFRRTRADSRRRPLTVDPSSQNQAIGCRLMLAALELVAERRFAGLRLVQSAYHYCSLCLYAKLGFVTRASLPCPKLF